MGKRNVFKQTDRQRRRGGGENTTRNANTELLVLTVGLLGGFLPVVMMFWTGDVGFTFIKF